MSHIMMEFFRIVENTVTQDPADKFHDFDKSYSCLVSGKMYYNGYFYCKPSYTRSGRLRRD